MVDNPYGQASATMAPAGGAAGGETSIVCEHPLSTSAAER
jgi:hypothetical protein